MMDGEQNESKCHNNRMEEKMLIMHMHRDKDNGGNVLKYDDKTGIRPKKKGV